MVTVTVCVGSSCHLRGARDVIDRFSEMLKQYGLEDRVTLQGSFCMERCGEGINWQVDEEPLTSANAGEAAETFRAKVLEPLGAGKEARRS
jgi:NADH-quinone oxidoreductase subunit G